MPAARCQSDLHAMRSFCEACSAIAAAGMQHSGIVASGIRLPTPLGTEALADGPRLMVACTCFSCGDSVPSWRCACH